MGVTMIPKEIQEAWDNREGPAVLATVSATGVPNVIYVGAIKLYKRSEFVSMSADYMFVISDSAFSKTRENILTGSSAALLFISKDWKAFQAKGRIEYATDGKVFESLRDWVDPKYVPVGATMIIVEEIYSGAERLV